LAARAPGTRKLCVLRGGALALLRGAVILLVEDDEDVRDMLEFTLESSGHVREVANHGRAALEALERQRPCLIILDLLMPVMTGWQVLAEMKPSCSTSSSYRSAAGLPRPSSRRRCAGSSRTSRRETGRSGAR